MHFLNINLDIVGRLRDNKIQLLNLCGLLCLAILLKGQMTTGGGKHTFNWQGFDGGQAGNNGLCVSIHPIMPYRTPGLFFDFENAPELDPDPNGQNGEEDKGSSQTGLLLLLLSNLEQCRTKSTLAYCATSLQKRIIVPLFVLHHAWKHFPT